MIVEHTGSVRLRVRWRRVFATLVAGALGLYLSVTAGAFLFVRYQQHVAAVAYLDFLTPSRWSRVRIARGNHNVAAATALMATGQRLQALFLVRDGIARSSANRDGRLLLAQLLPEAGRPDRTRQVFARWAGLSPRRS